MNKTKKAIRTISLFIMGVALTATVVMAQPGRENRPPELPDSARVQQMVKHLDADLNLSAEQKTKINALFIAHFEQVKTQREKEKPQMEQIRAAHEKVRNEFEASIKAELTAEQAQQFEHFNKEHQKKRGEDHRGKGNKRSRN